MHVTMLKINYLCPEEWHCDSVSTWMYNYNPGDMSNLEMKYNCFLYKADMSYILLNANSLQELVEKANDHFSKKNEKS